MRSILGVSLSSRTISAKVSQFVLGGVFRTPENTPDSDSESGGSYISFSDSDSASGGEFQVQIPILNVSNDVVLVCY